MPFFTVPLFAHSCSLPRLRVGLIRLLRTALPLALGLCISGCSKGNIGNQGTSTTVAPSPSAATASATAITSPAAVAPPAATAITSSAAATPPAALTSSATVTLSSTLTASAPVIAAYFTEWSIYTSGYSVDQIPAQWLTHIIYAFAQIEDGQLAMVAQDAALEFIPPHGDTATPAGNFAQLRQLREDYPHLKLLIAAGGWTLSSAFSDAALSAESRQRFATSAVAFIRKHGFDGIDLDWEYPVGGGQSGNVNRPEDKSNYTLLVRLLRQELDAAAKQDGRPYLLTVATPASVQQLDNFEIQALAADVDWFNLMAYDYSGAWAPQTGHLAPLDAPSNQPSVRDTVQAYRQRGVPADKIVLGIPFYSRGWAGVPPANHGLYQPASQPAKGSSEPGLIEYRDLMTNLRAAPEQWSIKRDAQTGAAFAYNPNLDGGTFYTLENLASVRTKTRWAQSIGLRGIMIWPLDGDLRKADDPDNLSRAIYRIFYPKEQNSNNHPMPPAQRKRSR